MRRNYNPLRLLITLSLAFIFVGQLVSSGIIGRCFPADTIVQTDTVFVRDTVLVTQPELVYVRIVDTLIVRMPVHFVETIHDTVYVPLPRQQAYYAAPDYEAWVSGYQPRLDSLHIFRETPVIETKVTSPALLKGSKPSRLSVGVQAGYGVTYSNGKLGTGPYLGIGLGYRF